MSIDTFLLSSDTTDLNYPEIRPTLDLNFARVKALDPRITFTRSSGGSYVGADGLIKLAGVNEARFDHNPTTGESLGLLVEEQRTNSLANNTMVGAVDGTPGTLPTGWAGSSTANGITREIVGTGTEDGIAYIDLRFSGTNTLGSNFFQSIVLSNSVVAATGQTWTGSAYVRLLAGAITGASFTGTGGSLILFGGPSFADNTSVSIASVSSARLATQRYSATRTFTNVTTTGADLRVAWTSVTGATIDFTLRIGLPQLEQGAFATSPILTSTAAATRSADVASITGSAFTGWYSQSEGTFVVGVPKASGIAVWSTARVLNVFGPRFQLGAGGDFAMVNDVSAVPFQMGVSPSYPKRIASAYKLGNYAQSNEGRLVFSTANTICTGQTVLQIGTLVNNFLSGTISRLTYYPKRLPNAQLQALTR